MIKWIWKLCKSANWIKRRVKLFDENTRDESYRLNHFINTYLEPDGIFMLQIIANNVSDFVATDLIKQLWKKHFEKYAEILKNVSTIKTSTSSDV